MNAFQDVFGGGEQQQSSSATATPINFNPNTNTVAPGLGTLANSYINTGAPRYTGPLTADMTGAQGTSLTNLANAVAPTNNVNSYISDVLSGAYMPGGAKGNPNISATISAANLPIQEQLNTALQITNPSKASSYGQQGPTTGTGSSALANANALAIQSAVNAESANATNIANNAYNVGVQERTAAAALQPQEVKSAIDVLQAQLLPTLLQEQGITNGITAFQDNTNALTTFLTAMASLASPVLGTSSTSTSTGQASNTPGILPDISNFLSAIKPAAKPA